MKKTVSVVLGLLVLAALLYYLWPGRPASRSVAQPDEVVIGAALSLTGDVAAYGERSRKGMFLALEEVNEEGGVNGVPVRIVLEDTMSSPKDGVSAIRKLIDVNGVKVVVGDILSSTTLAMAPIAERNHVVLLAPGASHPALREAGDYIFRNWASDKLDGQAIAAYAFRREGVRAVGILAQRTDYALGLADAFSNEISQLGGQVVLVEEFDTPAVDFRSRLAKMEEAGVPAIYISAEARQTGTILRQAKELDLDFSWFANLTVDTPECAEIAGGARNGVIFSTPSFDPESTRPEVQRFVAAFRSKYGETPEVAAGHAYDAVHILADVLRKNGTSADAIRDGLYGVKEYPGVTGVTTFDEYGDVIKDVLVKQVSPDGAELLEEFSFAAKQ